MAGPALFAEPQASSGNPPVHGYTDTRVSGQESLQLCCKQRQAGSKSLEGVGNASDPIGSLAGQAAGFGMEANILDGYKYIIHNYQKGDRIYIFGFSRGAHTARALAGLVSYAGIPKISNDQDISIWDDLNPLVSGHTFENKILELTKK